MRRSMHRLTILASLVAVLSLATTSEGMMFSTGQLHYRGHGDHIVCCATDVEDTPIVLNDITLYSSNGFVISASSTKQVPLPVTIPGQQGRCIVWHGSDGNFRCAFDLDDAPVSRIRTTMMITDDDGTPHGTLEGHPLTPPLLCENAGGPQCNGKCVDGSSCVYDRPSKRCVCRTE